MSTKGATLYKGRMNEEITVSFEEPGVYGYEGKPQYGLGMVGVIVVGEAEPAAANLEQARAAPHPAKARERFQRIFQSLGN